jgi:type IV pilus assembly protein PilB
MPPPRNFTDILLRRGVVSLDQLSEADRMARDSNKKVADCLIQLQYATGEEVMRAMAEQHKLEYVDLRDVTIPESVVELVPESVARENNILPLREDDDALVVVMSDPLDIETIDKLRFILNRKVDVSLAPLENIVESINKYYGQEEGESADSMLQEFTDTAIDFTEMESGSAAASEVVDENSAPVIRLVQLMITEAVQLRASDIHVEPFEDRIRIRYRIDGVLVERDSPPRRLLGAVLSRIKILSKLDIAERRRPQDGRIKVTIGEKELDLRVSVIPTSHGQSVVMRLLDKDNIKVSVKQLGFSEEVFQEFGQLIRRPNGIILVTGPTGSGKTTTLYAALNFLNRPDKKIITAEDPVEYYLPGINQVEVKHSIGLDFARIIRAMLRQAPNIILVGEMRDSETASMGIQASLTGHLVFSTLHTNDAPSAVTRMVDMGVPGYLIDAGISMDAAKGATFAKGKGCNYCQKKGFRGRVGIYELMHITPKIRELIFANASAQEIRTVAINQGMKTLYTDGMRKVMRGVTTMEEVYRNAKRTEQDALIT